MFMVECSPLSTGPILEPSIFFPLYIIYLSTWWRNRTKAEVGRGEGGTFIKIDIEGPRPNIVQGIVTLGLYPMFFNWDLYQIAHAVVSYHNGQTNIWYYNSKQYYGENVWLIRVDTTAF